MNQNKSYQQSADPRVLLFSHRNIFQPWVWRCPFQEFEKIIQGVDSVELMAPKATPRYQNRRRVALKLGEFVDIPMNPGVAESSITRDYDMFFTICERASDLLHLQALKGWRDHCKTTVCWLPEF